MADKVLIPSSHNAPLEGLLKVSTESDLEKRRRSIAIMIHGYPGNKSSNNDLFGDLEFTFSEKGISSLRFDLYGTLAKETTLENSQKKENLFTLKSAKEDLENVRQWVQKQGFNNIILVGEGLGATIGMASIQLDIKAMIMFWPVLDTTNYARKLKDQLPSRLIAELTHFSSIQHLRDVFMPLLVMQGAQDNIVPLEPLKLLKAHINSQSAEITTFQDGGHGLPKLNHRKAMFFHIGQFLEKYT